MTETLPTESATDTVEAYVRRQMSNSLGGRRGILEAVVPGIAFTIAWLVTKNISTALIAGGALAVLALLIRLLQRSDLRHATNAVIGIALGWAAVKLIAGNGGSVEHQALAVFVPGVIASTVRVVVVVISCLIRWPLIGFLMSIGSHDPFAWHRDPQVVRLCTRITLLYALPEAILVLLEGPLVIAGWTGAMNADAAVSTLAIIKLGLGWPLRAACWGAMIWLLGRNATPRVAAS